MLDDTTRDSAEIAVSRPAPSFVPVTRSLFIHSAFIFLACWLAFNWFQTIQRIAYCYTPLPVWDYWSVVQHYAQYRSLNPHFLWQQHNEHRIVFPEIVFALDMLLAHGRQILSLVVSFVCYFSIWIVIAWTLLSDKKLSLLIRLTAVLFAGIVIGWKGSASGLALPFLLQWTLSELAAIVSLALIMLAPRRPLTALTASIAAAVITTYSSGNGMMLWPILIAAACLLRLARKQILAVVISAVISVGLYFVGYQIAGALQLSNFYRHPFYSLKFISAYLGMPFGAMKSQTFGVYVGLFSLSIVILLFTCAIRARLLSSRPAIVLFGYYCFSLLTALITAAGRMNPLDPTFTAAKAERYMTVPLANWAVFVSLCLWLAGRRRPKMPALPAICLALLLAIGFLKLRWSVHVSDRNFADVQESVLSVENDLRDQKLMLRLYPDPAVILPLLDELKINHLSIYYRPLDTWLAQPASRFGQLTNDAVSGAVTEVNPINGGFQVFGWADASRYRWIVFVNEENRIAGFGEQLPAGVPYDLKNLQTPQSLSWVGFVNSSVKSSIYRAYVVNGRKLTPIQGSFAAASKTS